MDIAHGDRTGFTFAKIGPFALVGFLYRANKREWSGAKVHVEHGAIGASTYNLPMFFFDYLIERARKQAAIFDKLSDRQRIKAGKSTEQGVAANLERLGTSHWMSRCNGMLRCLA